MVELTIRERVNNIQNEILAGNLTPARASEMLVELSAIYGNILEEVRMRDMDYNVVLLRCYDEEETANRAKIRAEITPEYTEKTKAKNTEKLAIELTRNLKYFLRTMDQEFRMGNNF